MDKSCWREHTAGIENSLEFNRNNSYLSHLMPMTDHIDIISLSMGQKFSKINYVFFKCSAQMAWCIEGKTLFQE